MLVALLLPLVLPALTALDLVAGARRRGGFDASSIAVRAPAAALTIGTPIFWMLELSRLQDYRTERMPTANRDFHIYLATPETPDSASSKGGAKRSAANALQFLFFRRISHSKDFRTGGCERILGKALERGQATLLITKRDAGLPGFLELAVELRRAPDIIWPIFTEPMLLEYTNISSTQFNFDIPPNLFSITHEKFLGIS